MRKGGKAGAAGLLLLRALLFLACALSQLPFAATAFAAQEVVSVGETAPPADAADPAAEADEQATLVEVEPKADAAAEAGAGETEASFRLPFGLTKAEGSQRGLPDNIVADSFEIEDNGLISAAGNVRVSIRSMLSDANIELAADYVEYDLETGAAVLSGNVAISLAGSSFVLRAASLSYDPTMESMQVRGLEIGVPLNEIFDPAQLAKGPPDTRFDGHFYAEIPQSVHLLAEEADLSLDSESGDYVLRRVRITHSSRPDPDFYIKAREVRLSDDERVVFKDIAVYMSGIRIFAWPRLSRGLRPQEQPFGFNFPVIRIDRDVGIAWKQGVDFNYEDIRGEALLDYSAEYGLLTHSFVYTEPVEGARIGVSSGTRTAVDVDRRTVERREDYNFVWEQDFGEAKELYRDLDMRVEYGRLASAPRFQLPGQVLPAPVEDTRFLLDADIDFPLFKLGKDFWFAGGGNYRFVDYEDADTTYRVLGGRAGLVLRRGGFDHFVVLSSNHTGGDAVLAFDEMRKKELAFATSIRLLPDWRHVIRGSYDLGGDEFDMLEVGAMKRQKSYEIGVYWDFARDNAGFEFGLLMD